MIHRLQVEHLHSQFRIQRLQVGHINTQFRGLQVEQLLNRLQVDTFAQTGNTNGTNMSHFIFFMKYYTRQAYL